ncbi:tRNA glutamyl-Q(34) synthetase GluQRS [Rhodanobacter caeni]|uniref:Glutamyl-Q tRNA(Asp) synthetase n=1 Tax=Rhodanobacter caeni TaxID=657654 RepID=A0ABP3ECN9_9GAMM
MDYRGRFAPSPTGRLHFGSLVAALASWLCARQAGGQWLLRMEDLDPPREVAGAASSILATLPAFGLVADEPVLFQSRRRAAYDAAFEQLRAAGHLFACTCSRTDLAATGGRHVDGRCVGTGSGRAPAWRLRAPDVDIDFHDALQGPQRQNLRQQVGDFVIRRADGIYSYQLGCVVDDAFQQVTEVVRGHDLLDSTPRQIWLQRCLGLPTPTYRHLPLVLDEHGHKLSKSAQALPVDATDPLPALRCVAQFLALPWRDGVADVHAALAALLAQVQPDRLPRHNRRWTAKSP